MALETRQITPIRRTGSLETSRQRHGLVAGHVSGTYPHMPWGCYAEVRSMGQSDTEVHDQTKVGQIGRRPVPGPITPAVGRRSTATVLADRNRP